MRYLHSRETAGRTVESAEVLWESFGTATAPESGDLVSKLRCIDNKIVFKASDRKGNAVIAAKNASGKILWSWHIWMTDQPGDQVYNNDAGTMMDRNLGAVSAVPGDAGALGLLYQWGRKDPFLGSSSISGNTLAKSTITWPSDVFSDSSNGTISYAIANPTTFIMCNSDNYDWYYTEDSTTDDTRWQSSKTIYDPCPAGYRVPDGGTDGIWTTAFGTSSGFGTDAFDFSNNGLDFGSGVSTNSLTGTSSTCWYPAAGLLFTNSNSLDNVGRSGIYWSCTPDGSYACCLAFGTASVFAANSDFRVSGFSVRCSKE